MLLKRYTFSIPVTMLALAMLFCPTRGRELENDINLYFESIDSLLWSISVWPRMRSKDIGPVDGYFQKQIRKYPAFESLMRSNSKGKVINEVIGLRVMERTFRDIGKQLWYKRMSKTLEPYHGKIKRRGGGYFLFWSNPIKIRNRSGYRFGGAVAAKIDLVTCFNQIANNYDAKFKIIYKRKIIFSNTRFPTSQGIKKRKLIINGMPGVTVWYNESEQPKPTEIPLADAVTPVAPPAAASVNEPQPSAGPSDDAQSSSLEEPFSAVPEQPDVAPVESRQFADPVSSSANPVLIPLLIAMVVLGGIAILITMLIVQQAAKRKRIFDAIDKGEM